MRRLTHIACLCLMALALAGCFGSSSSDTGSTAGSADTSAPARDYYYDQFPDVAIPVDMSASAKDTFITYTADGLKLGMQVFSGRVEMGSLITVMQRYMLRDGWNLRSVFRAHRSILVFERSDRICALYISEGLVYTEMLVFVSPRLTDGAAHNIAPAPAAPPAPVSSSGGVQNYPAGGFSSSSSTSLSK